MSSVHITIGADVDVEEFLEKNAGRGRSTPVHWPVRKTAQIGDRVVFLIPSMAGHFVAVGYVATKPVLMPWGKRQQYAVSVSDIEPLARRVSIEQLHEKMPDWDWTRYARSYTMVPEEFTEQFWKVLGAPP